MIDVDFIKWLANKAIEFYWSKEDRLELPHGIWTVNDSCLVNPSWNSLIWPLLLQKAIEGINRAEGFLIFQNFSEIRIEHNTNHDVDKYYSFEDFGSEDNAKTAALKWIYNQEK